MGVGSWGGDAGSGGGDAGSGGGDAGSGDGDAGSGGAGVGYEDMWNMPLLKATLTEVLRLHPSVPLDFKQAVISSHQ